MAWSQKRKAKLNTFQLTNIVQHLPEEGVMFNADLPQPLGSSVVWKFEANSAFKLFILEREDIKIKTKFGIWHFRAISYLIRLCFMLSLYCEQYMSNYNYNIDLIVH